MGQKRALPGRRGRITLSKNYRKKQSGQKTSKWVIMSRLLAWESEIFVSLLQKKSSMSVMISLNHLIHEVH